MNSKAKTHLSKTIRALRERLIDDLKSATRRRYRLQVRARDAGLDEQRSAERARLEEYLAEQVRAEKQRGGERDEDDFFDEVVKEAAYTWLNRLALLRLMEEVDLVSPAVVDGGWDSKAYREFREWAPELMDDETGGYTLLLDIVFDELAHDLPGLYGDVGLTELVPMPPATLRATIEKLNDERLDPCWSDDTTFGWVYQYWNDPEREKLDAKLNSGGKIEPHEVASKTQLFTERYMVEWLLHNSLGQMWLAICKKNGWTPEVEEHGVLDALEERRAEWREKRENGEVELDELMPIKSDVEDRWKYWVPQPLPDEAVETAPDSVWDIQLLDPACGSGHFLVIAFDLLVPLYEEEARHRGEQWSTDEILDNVFETNLNGIDIDRRAVQIAAAALYLKARTVKQDFCPPILNLVAPDISLANLADDDPALVELREAVEAETGIPPKFVDRILDALGEAHHLGSLLKIDDEVEAAMEVLEPDEQTELFGGYGVEGLRGSEPASDSGGDQFGGTSQVADSASNVGEKSQTNDGSAESPSSAGPGGAQTPQPPNPTTPRERSDRHSATADEQSEVTSLSESSDVRRALVALLEDFLAHHSRSEDLGLRLRGEQLANGIRLVRLNREGRYNLVVANPPYSGTSKLKNRKYVKKTYPRGKADLYAAFIERCLQFTGEGGISGMVTMRNWMFISNYEELRRFLNDNYSLRAINDLGIGAFEEIGGHVVSTVLSVFGNLSRDSRSVALRSAEEEREHEANVELKRMDTLLQRERYHFGVNKLSEIDASPLVYWWEEEFLQWYLERPKLGELYPRWVGLCTTENTRFLRSPWELSFAKWKIWKTKPGDLHDMKWMPYIKGAAGNEWFEPLSHCVDFNNFGLEVRNVIDMKYGGTPQSERHYFKKGVAFSPTGDKFSARVHRYSSIFGNKGASLFPEEPGTVVCLMNSAIARYIVESLNPTIGFEVGDVKRIPLFSIESADEIFEKLDEAFTGHEQARETSVEFKKPGPSCWEYAQDWAQRAVDRDEGEPVPDWEPEYEEAPPENWLSWAIGVALGRFGRNGGGWLSCEELSSAESRGSDARGYEVEGLRGSETSSDSGDDRFGPTSQITDSTPNAGDKSQIREGPTESPSTAVPSGSQTPQPPNHATPRERSDRNHATPRERSDRNHATPRERSDRNPSTTLPHGILYVSATDGDDSLAHPACDLLKEMWDEYGDDLGKKRRKRDDLNSWIREAFFRKVHRQMYDNAPIYFPLTSRDKNFTAHINIHRWDEHTLRRLLADHLIPEKSRLEGRLADLNQARTSDDDTTRRRAESRYTEVKEWLEELTQFIEDVEYCAEKGPPPTDDKCPERETDARYVMDLDDGTMINAAGLWPLLDPNWRNYPKKWWKKLANEKGYRGKHFDWSKLAARYFPTRVDEKCQQDPSLAVAHNCFWRYHPARAFEWELRLQDEIHSNFTIDEPDSDHHRQTFLTEHRDKAEEIREDEYNRRKRNADGEEDIQPVVAIDDHPTSADEVPEADESQGLTEASARSTPNAAATVESVE